MSPSLAAEIYESVGSHVDTVLAEGRDTYGDERTPLLADALDPDTRTAVTHDARSVDDGRRLSNFAVQQDFLRTMTALSHLTGDGSYREEAESLTRWVLENLTSRSGLPYWGGHVAYDLDTDERYTGRKSPHELKFEYPYYELFWDVDPDATRQLVESMWNAHVIDWSKLDFNRHGGWDEQMGPLWAHDYEGGDVFFWGNGLTFVNTGSDLYYAAGLLSALDGDDDPLAWSKRLARRYVDTRQELGISGYQFSQHPSYCNGPAIRGDRAQYQFAPYIHGDHLVYEGTLFRPRPTVQRRQLVLGERLGERGCAFTRWAIEELQAWSEAAYRPAENVFEPMLTDGYSLEGFVVRREGYFGPKGRVVGPIEAGPEFFWTYAQAYRQTDDEHCWRTARDIADGLGLGDVGNVGGTTADLDTETNVDDYQALYGLLELYRATGGDAYLDCAERVGRNLLEKRTRDGLFVDDGLVQLEDPVPLALLQLAAALDGVDLAALPTPVGHRSSPAGGI